ncbi:MAG: PEP-CTERM/exosortase system-associated acyltransferase [Candidatus Omnitrophica bacterium]|nr:PEP-CTERM/exosortase system-associated acyltransferase [Candidatus Omnitrophota bacterium]
MNDTSRSLSVESMMDDIYRLRYQVFCKELKFMREADHPDGLEKDKYDPYSIHFTIEDSESVVGTLRLILDGPHGFPFTEYCGGDIDVDIASLDRKKICEFSRLAILKRYRKSCGEILRYRNIYSGVAREVTPAERSGLTKCMALGLYREIYQECKRRGITHVFALMEKPLWRFFLMQNFVFKPVSRDVYCYGVVQLYLTIVEEWEANLWRKAGEVFDFFMDGLEEEYRPHPDRRLERVSQAEGEKW